MSDAADTERDEVLRDLAALDALGVPSDESVRVNWNDLRLVMSAIARRERFTDGWTDDEGQAWLNLLGMAARLPLNDGDGA